MALKINAAVYSNIGHRKNNEDNFFFNGLYMEREQMNGGGHTHAESSDDFQMYAVCDGMGGIEFGEEASLMAVKALKKYKDECEQPDNSENLSRMIGRLSADIDQISLSKGMKSGSCGSTIAMVMFKDWYFRTLHVGDSRVYRLRSGKLERITKDDSEVQALVDRGMLTQQEAWSHPRKNVITRHLGMPMREGAKLRPHISPRMDLKAGDRYVICSDGLCDAVYDTGIAAIVNQTESPEDIAGQLVRTALSESVRNRIASDNITVIVLDVLEVGERGSDVRRVKRLGLVQKGLAALAALAACGFGFACYKIIQWVIR